MGGIKVGMGGFWTTKPGKTIRLTSIDAAKRALRKQVRNLIVNQVSENTLQTICKNQQNKSTMRKRGSRETQLMFRHVPCLHILLDNLRTLTPILLQVP